jgi:hypothetical protein
MVRLAIIVNKEKNNMNKKNIKKIMIIYKIIYYYNGYGNRNRNGRRRGEY